MINKIFQYDNVLNKLELNTPEILLIKEFKDLMEPKRNSCKADKSGLMGLRAFREMTYIWLAIDWLSIYADYTELERHQEALRDSEITEEEFNDPVFRAACRKYRAIQELNRSIKLLHAALEMGDKLTEYFQTADPLERDENTGKPIYKVKDMQAELKNIEDVLDTLHSLENKVKKELTEQSTIRGGAIEGYEPDF